MYAKLSTACFVLNKSINFDQYIEVYIIFNKLIINYCYNVSSIKINKNDLKTPIR